mgnify:CR=1 FL=1
MLTDTALRKAKPLGKPYKLFDGGGLYLEVFPHGSKLWRLKYRRADGKETRVSLGKYPDVPAPKARMERDRLKAGRAQGLDPANGRRMAKLRSKQAAGDSFEAVARDWFANRSPLWSPGRLEKITRRFERDLFPWIGSRPVSQIEPQELLMALKRVEARGAVETAHRARQEASMVFVYAIATGRAKYDPAAALKGALKPHRVKHFAAITEAKPAGELIGALRTYQGHFVTRCALQLAPMLFVRPGELRKAEWAAIDLDAAEWRFLVTKTKTDHIVPLATQAVAVLRELRPLTGGGRYVFPGIADRQRPMSENTVLQAIRRLGYTKEQMTGHGVRAMARTLLAEYGWKTDAIERQLSHKASGPLKGAYDRAKFLDERRKLMQAWADCLDALAAGTRKVVAIGNAA